MKSSRIKNTFIFLALVSLVAALFMYFYVYKEHRDIASEEATITTQVVTVFEAFQQNDSLARLKYVDKTIAFKGIVTSIDTNSNSIVLDSKLNVIFNEKYPILQFDQEVSVKGRLVGYDDLLEELQMDQSVLLP